MSAYYHSAMLNPQTFNFECPTCQKSLQVNTQIYHESEHTERGITVCVHSVEPVKCLNCETYIEFRVRELNLSFEVLALSTN